MGAITWGVRSKQRTVTVFCMDCRKVLNLHAPMAEALELKAAAEASHDCANEDHTTTPVRRGITEERKMRKTFTVTITCETAEQLRDALESASVSVGEDLSFFDSLAVDDSDEIAVDPNEIETRIDRIE